MRRLLEFRGVPQALLLIALACPAGAQLPVTRADAERAALSSGARVALARSDTALALAKLRTASTLPNPTLGLSYSKSVPTKHVSLELPLLDAIWTRGARLTQARAEARAARLLYASERLAALVDVDTTYTAALAADARFRLSRQNAREADSLRMFTVQRRDAGDASDLDVDLAAVSAGQQVNVATSDSLTYMSAVLTLQMLMGISPDSIAITLVDSLTLTARDTATYYVSLASGPRLSLPMDIGAAPAGITSGGALSAPSVLAAEASLTAATQGVAVQRRSIWQLPSISVGFESGDPDNPGLLPTFGITLPLPIFSRNQGPIAEAEAARERARIELLSARLEVRRRLVEGAREREQLIAKVVRDRDLVIRAQRVAEKSLTAYREGESGLPAVLEARRSAREVLSQYIEDLAALLTVNSELRALTQTVTVP